MNELPCESARVQIDGLIDGELSAAAAARLQLHLEGCADCRTRLEAKRKLVATLSTLASRPELSAAARQRLVAALNKRKRSFWWLAGPAAALAASLMLYLSLPATPDLAADAILSAHLRSLTPGHLTDVESSDRHTVKPWFNGRLPQSPPVPDLAAQGFPLTGGRLDYIGGQPAACLVYRRQLHVINLCLWPEGPLPGATRREGYNLLAWKQDGQNAAAISDLNRAELQQFKELWSAVAIN
jgi:anti-sigma factor RsiW